MGHYCYPCFIDEDAGAHEVKQLTQVPCTCFQSQDVNPSLSRSKLLFVTIAQPSPTWQGAGLWEFGKPDGYVLMVWAGGRERVWGASLGRILGKLRKMRSWGEGNAKHIILSGLLSTY